MTTGRINQVTIRVTAEAEPRRGGVVRGRAPPRGRTPARGAGRCRSGDRLAPAGHPCAPTEKPTAAVRRATGARVRRHRGRASGHHVGGRTPRATGEPIATGRRTPEDSAAEAARSLARGHPPTNRPGPAANGGARGPQRQSLRAGGGARAAGHLDDSGHRTRPTGPSTGRPGRGWRRGGEPGASAPKARGINPGAPIAGG